MRTIVISGWYGSGNVGDEAILTATLDTFLEREPDLRFVVVSEAPEQVERDYRGYPLRAVPQRSYYGPLEAASGLASGTVARVWSAIQGADLFLLGGGGLLRDNTSKRNLVRILDECGLAMILGVPVAFFAIGVGPIETKWGARIIRLIGNRAATITVRDRVSADLLRSIGVLRPPIHVTADPAFLLRAEDAASDGAPSAGFPPDGRGVGVFPCEGLFWGGRADSEERERILGELAALCDHFVQRMSLTPVFLPFRTGAEGDDDLVVVDQILARMRTKRQTVRVADVLPPKRIRGLMGRFRYVLGARLHSLILATAAGTPCIGLAYEPKVKRFMESVGPLGHLVDLSALRIGPCAEFLSRCESAYDALRSQLSALAAERASEALRTFDLVSQTARPARSGAPPGARR